MHGIGKIQRQVAGNKFKFHRSIPSHNQTACNSLTGSSRHSIVTFYYQYTGYT